VIIDHNNLQGYGRNVLKLDNLSERLKSFGWDSYDADGHDIEGLSNILAFPHSSPKAIVAHTIKGKGISFMEDKLEWHYKSPDQDQLTKALRELEESD
jgi:transketolase